ncbi:hypothetical protein MBT84_31610 [Streptomyces sp. MBT84]|nr:hypothetical protein [Streptomyces sp. MBT84]
MSQAAPDATEAAGGPDPLALESGRRHIHARIDARFTMAPPRRLTILVTRSDEKWREFAVCPNSASAFLSGMLIGAQHRTIQHLSIALHLKVVE